MRKLGLSGVFAAAIISLFACTPQQQTLPTLVSTPTVPPTSAAATGTPTTEPTRRVPPTFPPTWTPSSVTIQTPEATPTTEGAPLVIPSPLPTPLAACATFGADGDRNVSTFPIGSAPQIFWTPVQGAASYHVALLLVDPNSEDASGEEMFGDFTTDTSYTFQADLFELGKFYGWEVYPIDALGQQMCLSLGDELIPTQQ